jgi:large subunit ribosomal protein L30
VGRIAITLKRSLIGSRADQRQTIRALGLRRVGHSVEHNDSADLRGMINKIRHLVVLEEKN